MFSLKNKLQQELKKAIDNNCFKSYKVIIHCKQLQESTEKKITSSHGYVTRSIPYIGCFSANISANVITRLIEYPQIDYICFDDYSILCGSSVFSANNRSIHMKHKFTGKNISIGIIDSGVYPHVDICQPTNKIESFIDLINDLKYPYDDNGHGTFISGLICGSGFSSKGMYKGVAENSTIFMIKAFNSIGKGYASDILYALAVLIDKSKTSNIKVLCLPFELINYNHFILKLFYKLFEKAIENNLIIIVPSGNNGNSESSMRGIATLSNCITVGGLNTLSTTFPYESSSSGPCGNLNKPDFSAACVDICSLNSDINYISEKNGNKLYPHKLEKLYTNYSGTSCAAAYIAGICALSLEKNPNLTYKDMLSLFKINSTLEKIPIRLQGKGVIDLNSLLNL